jgi:hypothetical protein
MTWGMHGDQFTDNNQIDKHKGVGCACGALVLAAIVLPFLFLIGLFGSSR